MDGYYGAVKKIGFDPRFLFRSHQALWCYKASPKGGVVVELGTGKGFIMQQILSSYPMAEIYLVDTFNPNKVDIYGRLTSKKSRFYCDDLEDVKNTFSLYPNVEIIQGFCPDVLTAGSIDLSRGISFLHVDLNSADAEIASLSALQSYFKSGCIILLDDFANQGRELQTQAFNEFFTSRDKPILTLAAGQGLVVW